eukprot:jgi/Tetstr1/422879/TSEL_013670.t1
MLVRVTKVLWSGARCAKAPARDCSPRAPSTREAFHGEKGAARYHRRTRRRQRRASPHSREGRQRRHRQCQEQAEAGAAMHAPPPPLPAADLQQAALRPWLTVAPALAGGLLYLDEGAGEAAAAGVGLPALLGLGAANVCSLEAASREDMELALLGGAAGDTPHLVMVLTQLLTDAHAAVLRAAAAHPVAPRLLLLSAVSEIAHAGLGATPLGPDAFSEYRSMLAEDAARARPPGAAALRIDIKYFPLPMCALDRESFVLPAASAAAVLSSCGRCPAGFWAAPAAEADGGEEGEGAQGGLSLTAHSLVAVAAQLGFRLEPSALGPAAKALGGEVARLAVPASLLPPGAPEPRAAALLLIDRSMDLATPAMHHPHLLSQMLEMLPRRPAAPPPPHAAAGERVAWRPADMRVPMGAAFPLEAEMPACGGSCLIGGSLWAPDDKQATERWERLLRSDSRAAQAQLREWLRAALEAEQCGAARPSEAGGRLTPEELAGMTEPLLARPEAMCRHRNLLQWAAATAHVLRDASQQRWQALAAEELALVAGADDGEELAARAAQLLARRGPADPTPLSEALLLLAAAYSLAGNRAANAAGALPWEQELRLKEAVVDAVVESGDALGAGWLAGVADSLKAHAAVRRASAPGTAPAAAAAPGEGAVGGAEGAAEGWEVDEEELAGLEAEGWEGGGEALLGLGVDETPAGPGESWEGGEEGEEEGGGWGWGGDDRWGQSSGHGKRMPGAAAARPGDSFDQRLAEQRLRLELRDAVDGMFSRLHSLGAARAGLAELREVASSREGMRPLLQQVAERLLQDQPLSDFSAASGSLVGGLLSSGLGRLGFGPASAAKPSDHPLVLVFVVGGICPEEIRQVREVMAQRRPFGNAPPQVILGGTALLSPADVYRHFYA